MHKLTISNRKRVEATFVDSALELHLKNSHHIYMYIDKILQPLVLKLLSYDKDTNVFLEKIKNIL